MRRKIDILVHPSKADERFIFGTCASHAICGAFGLPSIAFRTICKLMKIDYKEEGLTFFEIKRIINILTENRCIYIPNISEVTYSQMLFLLPKRKYLVVFDEHLSFCDKGEIFDTFFCGGNIAKIDERIPTGWWRID